MFRLICGFIFSERLMISYSSGHPIHFLNQSGMKKQINRSVADMTYKPLSGTAMALASGRNSEIYGKEKRRMAKANIKLLLEPGGFSFRVL